MTKSVLNDLDIFTLFIAYSCMGFAFWWIMLMCMISTDRIRERPALPLPHRLDNINAKRGFGLATILLGASFLFAGGIIWTHYNELVYKDKDNTEIRYRRRCANGAMGCMGIAMILSIHGWRWGGDNFANTMTMKLLAMVVLMLMALILFGVAMYDGDGR